MTDEGLVFGLEVSRSSLDFDLSNRQSNVEFLWLVSEGKARIRSIVSSEGVQIKDESDFWSYIKFLRIRLFYYFIYFD